MSDQKIENQNDLSFGFYRSMNPKKPRNFWSNLFCASLLFLWVLFLLQADENVNIPTYLYFLSVGICILCCIPYVYSWIYIFLTFPHFKHWQRNLPFALKGWGQLSESKNNFSPAFWKVHCRIQINLKGNYRSYKDEIDSLCSQFAEEASKLVYYVRNDVIIGYASDPRIQWSYNNNVLEGSSNILVVQKIYYFISSLGTLVKKHDVIESIEITADEKEMEFALSYHFRY